MLVVWLTGRPCSGKTTIGVEVVKRLNALGWKSELLDGDLTRRNLWPELGFSHADRDANLTRFTYLAEMLSRHHVVPVVCAVSPYRAARDRIRTELGANFIEIYVNASLELCEQRDVKGMYKKARNGQIPDFTGVQDDYEPPLNPEAVCFTERETVDQSAAKVMNAIDTAYSKIEIVHPWSKVVGIR